MNELAIVGGGYWGIACSLIADSIGIQNPYDDLIYENLPESP